MASIEDLYDILGLQPRASAEEIRAAYRARARQVHPDVVGAEGTAEFVRLNRAYETLIDPYRRRAYDEQFLSYRRETTVRRRTARAGWLPESFSLGAILTEMVSSLAEETWAGLERPVEVPAIHVELILGPEAAHLGSDVRLEVPVTVICQNCGGSGLAQPFVCPVCRGRGRWTEDRRVQFFLQPPIRDGQTVTVKLQAADVPVTQLHLHIRLSWL